METILPRRGRPLGVWSRILETHESKIKLNQNDGKKKKSGEVTSELNLPAKHLDAYDDTHGFQLLYKSTMFTDVTEDQQLCGLPVMPQNLTWKQLGVSEFKDVEYATVKVNQLISIHKLPTREDSCSEALAKQHKGSNLFFGDLHGSQAAAGVSVIALLLSPITFDLSTYYRVIPELFLQFGWGNLPIKDGRMYFKTIFII